MEREKDQLSFSPLLIHGWSPPPGVLLFYLLLYFTYSISFYYLLIKPHEDTSSLPFLLSHKKK